LRESLQGADVGAFLGYAGWDLAAMEVVMTGMAKMGLMVCLVGGVGMMGACLSGPVAPVGAASAGPDEAGVGYRVLKPIESGDLTLFPVVRGGGKSGADPFLTLDEGLRSGEVEVTEAGKVRGLVRSRSGAATPAMQPYQQRGDQVNTLVLVNHSSKPLLLLAGEIVTGGKQDRIVASDRIVPGDSDPIDLGVFCVEHGRWTESSEKFGVSAKLPAQSFMVQPEVRQQAMVAKSQQQVWDSVSNSVGAMAMAAAPAAVPAGRGSGVSAGLPPGPPVPAGNADGVVISGAMVSPGMSARSVQAHGGSVELGTTSYAKAMANGMVAQKVDEAAPELAKSREAVLAQLKAEHAVGVVVAVKGEIIWADIFADSDLLSRYWVKLVRSYAAEGLTTAGRRDAAASMGEAQRFLDTPMRGVETSKGEVGVYRYEEAKVGTTEQFVLESLLPGAAGEVHVSRLKVKGAVLINGGMMLR